MKTTILKNESLVKKYYWKVKMSFIALTNGDATNNQLGACMACIVVPAIIILISILAYTGNLANRW